MWGYTHRSGSCSTLVDRDGQARISQTSGHNTTWDSTVGGNIDRGETVRDETCREFGLAVVAGDGVACVVTNAVLFSRLFLLMDEGVLSPATRTVCNHSFISFSFEFERASYNRRVFFFYLPDILHVPSTIEFIGSNDGIKVYFICVCALVNMSFETHHMDGSNEWRCGFSSKQLLSACDCACSSEL